MQPTKNGRTKRHLAEGGDRKPVGYFHNVIERKIQEGDYELLAPGVTQVSVENENITFRHISVFHALSRFDNSSGLWVVQDKANGIEQILSVIMAAHHFNNRVSTIVPKLANLSECDIKVTFDVFDTQRLPAYATKQLVLDILPRLETSILNESRKYPTGIVGGLRSATSQLLAIIGGVSNLTQVSYSSVADELDNKDKYPFFGRVVSPVSDVSKAAAEYFTQELQASHVFVIYVQDSLGTSIFKSFQQRASQLGLVTRSASLSNEGDIESDIKVALDRLQQSGYRYVYATLYGTHYKAMLPKALDRGLAGGEPFGCTLTPLLFPISRQATLC